MSLKMIEEDDHSYTVDVGHGHVCVAKTPGYDVEGGVYHLAKSKEKAYFDGGRVIDDNGFPVAGLPSDSFGPAPDPMPAPMPGPTPMPPAMVDPDVEARARAEAGMSPLPTPVPGPAPQMPGVAPVGSPATSQVDESQVAPAARPPQPLPPQSPLVDVQKTTTVDTRNSYDPKAMAAYSNAENERANALRSEGDALGQIEKEKGAAAQQKTALDQKYQKDADAHVEEVTRLKNEYNARMPKLIDEYMKDGIKPKTLFEDGNIGQNLMAGLAIGLGALGGAFDGGSDNVGLKVMNDAIDRDLKAQQMNMEKKGQAINMLGVYYKSAMDMGATEQQAQALAKASAFEAIGHQLEATVANSNSDIVKERAKGLAAGIDAEKNKNFVELSKATRSTTTENSQIARSKLMKDVPPPPPAIQEKALEVVNRDYQLSEIQKMYDAVHGKGQTGQIEGLFADLKNNVPGLRNADYATLRMELGKKMLTEAKTYFGASKTKEELAEYMKTTPTGLDKPEVFKAMLDRELKSNAHEYDTIHRSYPGALPRLPLSTDAKIDYSKKK